MITRSEPAPPEFLRGALTSPAKTLLFALAVFGGNVVLGNFFCGDFASVGVRRILDAANDLGLEGLSFFRQLRDAF